MGPRELVGAQLTCVDEKYAANELNPTMKETDGYIPLQNVDNLGFRTICPYCRTVTDFIRPEISARGKMYLYTCWDCDGEQILNLSEVATFLQRGERKRTRREKTESSKPGPARRAKKRKEAEHDADG